MEMVVELGITMGIQITSQSAVAGAATVLKGTMAMVVKCQVEHPGL